MKRAGSGAFAIARGTRHSAGLSVSFAAGLAALSFSPSARAFEVDTRAEERTCPAADPAACPQPDTGGGALLGDQLELVVGPGFVLLRGAQSVAEAACAPQPIATAAMRDALERSERQLGVDAQLGILLSSAAPSCNSIYYVPLANDVRGIGYAHDSGRELFDDSPESALEGIAFLNDWPYWKAHAEEFQSAFHHEVAHRWGARVWVQLDGFPSSELLGRGASHWSFFLDSRGSPHEGNLWVADATGLHSETPRHGSQFSPLDLYLMGVGLPEDVEPFELLRRPEVTAADCRGKPVTAASPPQSCESIRVSAEPAWLRIDDILAVEGPRDPPASKAGRGVTALVVVVDSPRAAFGPADCRELGAVLGTRFSVFEQATLGRLRLQQLLAGRGDCDAPEWTPPALEPQRSTSESGCALRAPRGCTDAACPAALIGLLLLARVSSRRARARR